MGDDTRVPQKPRADFPLWWRRDPRCKGGGYWCKKIPGEKRPRSFGADAELAEKLYDEHLQALEDGRDVELTPSNVTVDDVYDKHIETQHVRATKKQITDGQFCDTRRFLDHFCAFVGPEFPARKLRPTTFTDYWHKLNAEFGTEQVNKRVNAVRRMFAFADESDLLAHPMRFGPVFKPAGRDDMEKLRDQQKADKTPYTPKQVRLLIRKTSTQMKAMILMAINCAFGPKDLAALPLDKLHIKIVRDDAGNVVKAIGRHDFPRPKNKKVERVCFLFPETVLALEAWFKNRAKLLEKRKPANAAHESLVFLTRQRRPWVGGNVHRKEERIEKEVRWDSLNLQFRKVCKALGIPARFYRLRHTAATWLDQVNDPTVEARIRGHKLPGMKRVYVHAVEGKRLRKAVRKLHRKLYPIRKKPAEASTSAPAAAAAETEPREPLTSPVPSAAPATGTP